MCVVVKCLLFTLQIYVFMFNKQTKYNKNCVLAWFLFVFRAFMYISLPK